MIPTDYPEKLVYTIGEVSRIAGVKPHVLRYWETEFSEIRPEKSDRGQRRYRKKDLEAVLEIKSLLYDQRFTVDGARRALRGLPQQPVEPAEKAVAGGVVRSALAELKGIRELLNG